MKQRGQVAIEFIFILLIIIIYIFTVTKPLIDSSVSAVDDIERISKIKNETEKLSNAVNETHLLGNGTKRTIFLFIPNNARIFCEENLIGFSATINDSEVNPEVQVCANNICDYNADIYSGFTINCLQKSFPTGQYQVTVEKINDRNISLTVG